MAYTYKSRFRPNKYYKLSDGDGHDFRDEPEYKDVVRTVANLIGTEWRTLREIKERIVGANEDIDDYLLCLVLDTLTVDRGLQTLERGLITVYRMDS